MHLTCTNKQIRGNLQIQQRPPKRPLNLLAFNMKDFMRTNRHKNKSQVNFITRLFDQSLSYLQY